MAEFPPAEITLFGATGYTGQRIAHTLARDGLSFRIAGRSGDKLATLSAQLPNKPPWIKADAAESASLPPLFKGTRLLINCAGPFTDLGERVIAQAAMNGTHYLDITNELGYLFRARGYNQMALHSGAALVTACGFEVALADCLANLTGSALSPEPDNPLDAVEVVYALSGQASRGTRKSAVRSIATSWLAYREGDWTGQIPSGRVRSFALPNQKLHALSIPSCESITVPAHQPVKNVHVWMTVPSSARIWAPVSVPLMARLARSILRGMILRIAERGGVKPEDAAASDKDELAPFTVYTRASRGRKAYWMALEGSGPYKLTAEIIAYYARMMIQPGYNQKGLLAPSQALDPHEVIAYAQNNWGLQLTRDPGITPPVDP